MFLYELANQGYGLLYCHANCCQHNNDIQLKIGPENLLYTLKSCECLCACTCIEYINNVYVFAWYTYVFACVLLLNFTVTGSYIMSNISCMIIQVR